MKLNELKAANLKALIGLADAQMAVELTNRNQYQRPSFVFDRCQDVEHRGLNYTVGRWADWQGDFWVVEQRTGIIFRGSLSYIKEVIRVCSAAAHENKPFQSNELKVKA